VNHAGEFGALRRCFSDTEQGRITGNTGSSHSSRRMTARRQWTRRNHPARNLRYVPLRCIADIQVEAGSGATTPVPLAPPPKLPPCACCRRMDPKSTMARCKTCTFSAHSGCYGIPPEDTGPNWECELCANARLEENHLEPKCVLCPRDTSALVKKGNPSKRPGGDFDMLSVLKPTEGRRWAHVLCSAWVEGVMFTNKAGMKDVEGIVGISSDKWEDVSGTFTYAQFPLTSGSSLVHCAVRSMEQ
jgi:hypothetical protein